ncbi:ParA family protein [Hyphomicrobium sp. ghe19]|uniref:ParA family protein n=1 Tax=Hyphomicrobium sp. ghe19 TaxID=2682968 RepID=UPI0013673BB7|nr:Chromosome-partitioning ATPase Soj [Hyphomicrobium sp. ghe19]
MTKVIAIGSGKGGSGKTTLTVTLAVRASKEARRVAIIDLNSDQGNLSQWWLIRGEPDNPLLFDDFGDLDTLLSTLRRQKYEWVFLDCPPGDLDLTESAIMASDAVLVPVKASAFDAWAAESVTEICKRRKVPFAFILTAVDSKMKTLNAHAIKNLSAEGQVFKSSMAYKASQINAVVAGKAGFEADKELKPEADAIFTELKSLAGGTNGR